MTGPHRALGVVFVLLAAACGVVEPNDPRQTIEFSADAETVADTVRVTLFIRNPSDEAVRLDWGGCHGPTAAALLVYDSSDSTGTPRWDERIRDTSQPCFAVPSTLTIQPGEEVASVRGYTGERILGDSLPAGSYRLAVVPDFRDLVVGTELEVGVFHLSR